MESEQKCKTWMRNESSGKKIKKEISKGSETT